MVDCAPTGRLIGLQGAGQLEALFAFSGSACAALPAPPPLASRNGNCGAQQLRGQRWSPPFTGECWAEPSIAADSQAARFACHL
jgi:hypothetical protein